MNSSQLKHRPIVRLCQRMNMRSDRALRVTVVWIGMVAAFAPGLCACLPSQVPARQVSEVARDLNLAARFGRMDVAAEHTSEAHRQRFMESRADWGHDVRVVDIELAQLDVPDSERAEVVVDVSWVRIDEGLLRSTRIRQNYRNPGGGWQLSGEERIAGDFGLLGENVTILRPPSRDTHFPTKVIGPTKASGPQTIR
jgi:hypothetical protein